LTADNNEISPKLLENFPTKPMFDLPLIDEENVKRVSQSTGNVDTSLSKANQGSLTKNRLIPFNCTVISPEGSEDGDGENFDENNESGNKFCENNDKR